jgi:membrane-associated phospholipid phosphatase
MSSSLPGEGRFVRWVHQRAYDSRLRPRLHTLETVVPYGGAAIVYLLLGLLALRDETRRPALRAMAAGVVAWITSDALKELFERQRPCLHHYSCGNHSFPEGPGMVLAALAVAIWPTSRPIAVVAVVCAIADAAVQLAYGNHWPSDLVGAWIIGGLCGFAVPRIAEWLTRIDRQGPSEE